MYGTSYARRWEREQKKPAHCVPAVSDLLDMAVVADMVFAITIVALAPGTVPEFQFRIADVGSAADGAPVGIGGFLLFDGFIRTGVKLDDLWLFGLNRLFAEFSLCLDPPGQGKNVQYVLAEEQEVVGKRDYREQIVWEGIGEKIQHNDSQVKECKDPGFHRNDEEQQKLCIREQCCITEEQAEIQIDDAGGTAEDHAVNIHHEHAGEIKQIEPQRTPDGLHGPTQGIVAEQGNCHQQQIIDPVGKRIRDQPPDLTLEDFCTVKIKQIVQQIIAGHFTHDVDQGGTQGNIQHQIGNAFGTVFVAVEFELPS